MTSVNEDGFIQLNIEILEKKVSDLSTRFVSLSVKIVSLNVKIVALENKILGATVAESINENLSETLMEQEERDEHSDAGNRD